MNVAELLSNFQQLLNDIENCKTNKVMYGVRMDENFKKYIKHFIKVVLFTNGNYGHIIVDKRNIYLRMYNFIENYFKDSQIQISNHNNSVYTWNEAHKYQNIENINFEDYLISNQWTFTDGYQVVNFQFSKNNQFNKIRITCIRIKNRWENTYRYEVVISFIGNVRILSIPYSTYRSINNNDLESAYRDMIDIYKNNKNMFNNFIYSYRYNRHDYLICYSIYKNLEFKNDLVSKLCNKFSKIRFSNLISAKDGAL